MARTTGRATGTSDDALPKWFTGAPLICCKGGPYARSWYFLDWWLACRAEGAYQRCGYIPTGRHSSHPDHPDNRSIRAATLVWEPTVAAAMTDEQWRAKLPKEMRI